MKSFQSVFSRRERTGDGAWTAGRDGLREIYEAPDGKSEILIQQGGDMYIRLMTGNFGPILYPYRPVPRSRRLSRAVLMDLDGTSVLSEEFWIRIVQETARQLSGNPRLLFAREDLPFVSGFSVDEHLRYCIGKYAPGECLARARAIYEAVVDREMEAVQRGGGNEDAFVPRAGLKAFLAELKAKGVPVGLVTSGLRRKAVPEILAAFRKMRLGDPLLFYDAVITAGTAFHRGETGTLGELCAKPHPWLYRETLQVGMGVEAGEGTYVVEDSSAGVLAGALAGCCVIGMRGGNIEQSGLDCLTCAMVDTLQEALEIIKGEEAV